LILALFWLFDKGKHSGYPFGAEDAFPYYWNKPCKIYLFPLRQWLKERRIFSTIKIRSKSREKKK
jgi:hypothetical protein